MKIAVTHCRCTLFLFIFVVLFWMGNVFLSSKVRRKMSLGVSIPHTMEIIHISMSKMETILHGDKYLKFNRRFPQADCANIINSNASEIKGKGKKNKLVREAKPPDLYLKQARNCSTYITSRGYITSALTKEEELFPIAFSILMYKDVEQSERLLRAIYRPQNLYCIHVDKKSSQQINDAMLAIAKCFDNVFLIDRIPVVWGTMSVLQPELMCMEESLKKSMKWKYFINLTGQEFPLQSNYKLVQFLKSKNGSNVIESSKPQMERYANAGPPPHSLQPKKGSVHIAVTREFVDFILHDNRTRDLLKWCEKTKIPDETFFATIAGNPILNAPGTNTEKTPEKIPNAGGLRLKMWEYEKCRGKQVRSICIFGTGDLPLLASMEKMFANKFHLNYGLALDCTEELHYNRTRDNFYENLAKEKKRSTH